MMSTLRNVGDTFGFYAEPSSSLLQRFLAAVRTYGSGIRGGLEAARTYHELTRQGVPHEIAVERIFDRELSGR
jgi:hypothetical protein